MKRVCVALLLLVSIAGSVEARMQRDLGWTYQQIWPALVRFLRVDERLKVTEKDADDGYVLFELTEGKRTFNGAAQLLRVTDGEGHEATRVMIQLYDRPSYMEQGLLDRLEQKLRDELGEPPPPQPTTAPAKPTEEKP